MRFLLFCLALTGSLGLTTAALAQAPTAKRATPARSAARKPGTKTVRGHNGQQTIACQDDDVVVSGNNNEITLKGTCTRLIITGSGNTVHAGKLWVLRISGDNNMVQWTGAAPKITDTGAGSILSAQ